MTRVASMSGTGTEAAGLGTRGARYTLLLVWMLGIWSTLMHGVAAANAGHLAGSSALHALSLLMLTAPGGGRLPALRAALCAVAAVLAGLLALYAASPQEDSWPFNFATYLLALLTIRGNVREGVSGGAALITAGLLFGVWSGEPATEVAAFLALPTIAFIVGIVWRVAIAAAMERERRHLSLAAAATLAAEATETASARDQALIDDVRAEAAPVLEQIQRDEVIGEAEAIRIAAVAEGTRDRIRSPGLRHPLLDAEVRTARQRGVTVTLLGTESAPLRSMQAPLALAVAAIVAQAARGSVTVREHPPGHRAAVSVLVSDAGSSRRHALGHDGVPR